MSKTNFNNSFLINRRRESFAALSFALLLSTWLFIPFGGSGDMDYHLTSIWCALGEKQDLCNDIQTLPEDPNAGFSNHVTAEVPFMFQICDSRNIDYWPYCEFEIDHPETQLRAASRLYGVPGCAPYMSVKLGTIRQNCGSKIRPVEPSSRFA